MNYLANLLATLNRPSKGMPVQPKNRTTTVEETLGLY